MQAGENHLPALVGKAAIAAYFERLDRVSARATTSDFAVANEVVVTARRAPEESITNTQEAGVDEGGIVKRRGDHLVILRRGRLFSVSIAENGLRAIDRIDAFPPGDEDPGDTWYDEMLVEGDQVVVIGYSYGYNETEVNRFNLSPDGRFTFRDTHYLTSADYYSSRNYASRLIGDQLLFYAPIPISHDAWRESLPSVRQRGREGELAFPRRNDGANRLYLPRRFLDDPNRELEVLHTVTSCTLGQLTLPCRSTMVLGPWGRDFYFSPTAAYVWTDEIMQWRGRRSPRQIAPPMLYRIPLDGSKPSAIGVSGSPVDQFSFRENAGASIDILTREHDGGGGMWGGEVSEGAPMLLQLPLSALGDGSEDADRERYRELPPVEGWRFFNRFVGRHLLYAAGGYGEEEATPRVHIVPLDKPWVTAMPLPHGVTRFDALGSDAVAIGPSAEGALGFSSIRLDGESGAVSLANTYLMPDAEEGETRSQALFYRPEPGSADGADGRLGLPVSRRLRDDGGEFLGDASTIAFLRREDRRLSPAGELESRPVRDGGEESDNCQASCVDWYGNARPIFIGDRIFALMGYELVEGRESGSRVVERRRLDFAPAGGRERRQ